MVADLFRVRYRRPGAYVTAAMVMANPSCHANPVTGVGDAGPAVAPLARRNGPVARLFVVGRDASL